MDECTCPPPSPLRRVAKLLQLLRHHSPHYCRPSHYVQLPRPNASRLPPFSLVTRSRNTGYAEASSALHLDGRNLAISRCYSASTLARCLSRRQLFRSFYPVRQLLLLLLPFAASPNLVNPGKYWVIGFQAEPPCVLAQLLVSTRDCPDVKSCFLSLVQTASTRHRTAPARPSIDVVAVS